MNSDIYKILSTQFITAFADNAVLFIVVTMVMQQSNIDAWYIPALQASFLVAYVIFAPWVGRLADNQPKRQVMLIANLIKAFGALLLLIHIEPMLAYGLIGLGAAMYSPAKYGILPEVVTEEDLVKANGWVEGSTILAILSGTLIGAMLAEYSIFTALLCIITLYLSSALIARTIKHHCVIGITNKHPIKTFYSQIQGLLNVPIARFAILGVSMFWASASVLRVLLIAWVPLVLHLKTTTDIAMLTLFIAIGIAIGSLIAPKLIPIKQLQKTRFAAYAMGCIIVILSVLDSLWGARLALFLTGICGGLFVVPINAALQEIGHRTIGAGGVVAVENFFNNLAMLIASGIYAVMAGSGVSPITTMTLLGTAVLILIFLISFHIPKNTVR